MTADRAEIEVVISMMPVHLPVDSALYQSGCQEQQDYPYRKLKDYERQRYLS